MDTKRKIEHKSTNQGEYYDEILGSVLQYSRGFGLCRSKASVPALMLKWKSLPIPPKFALEEES